VGSSVSPSGTAAGKDAVRSNNELFIPDNSEEAAPKDEVEEKGETVS